MRIVNDKTYASEAFINPRHLLVFSAVWCKPCQAMKPVLEKIDAEVLPVLSVDFDNAPALSTKYNVKSVPQFLLFAEGKCIGVNRGAMTFGQLRKWVEDAEGLGDE